MPRNKVSILAALDDQVSKGLDRIQNGFTGITKSKGFKQFTQGVGMGAGVAAWSMLGQAVGMVGDVIGESIQAASDLNESLSKSNVVFGANAGEIERWSKTSAQAFGMSQQAALEAAGTYGNLFQSFGIGQAGATEMSKRLVQLAADLASFNNTNPQDALEALRSGLSGETEPLKRYGIAISDARERQYLMEQGVKDLGATLTPLQKSTAAYALILKDTALAQGDFARTSDGLANSQRILTAEQKNLQTEIGKNALPLAIQWDRANLEVLKTINAMADATHAETNTVRQNADALNQIGHLLPGISQLYDALAGNAINAAADQHDMALAMSDLSNFSGKMKDEFPGATGAVQDLGKALGDTATAAADAKREIDGLATTVETQLFGGAINAGHLAELKQTNDELLKQRDAAKKGSSEYTILTGKIAENQQAQFDLQLQMAQKAGPEALLKFLNDAQTEFGLTNVEVLKEIQRLKTLYGLYERFDALGAITFGRFAGKTISTNAAGGPVSAGEYSWVGEQGPELVRFNQPGTVYPAGQSAAMASGGGGGSPVVLAINLDSREIGRVVDRRLYLALAGAGGSSRPR